MYVKCLAHSSSSIRHQFPSPALLSKWSPWHPSPSFQGAIITWKHGGTCGKTGSVLESQLVFNLKKFTPRETTCCKITHHCSSQCTASNYCWPFPKKSNPPSKVKDSPHQGYQEENAVTSEAVSRELLPCFELAHQTWHKRKPKQPPNYMNWPGPWDLYFQNLATGKSTLQLPGSSLWIVLPSLWGKRDFAASEKCALQGSHRPWVWG